MTQTPKKDQIDGGSTVNKVGGGGPTALGRKRHVLLIGQRIRQLPDKFDDPGRPASGRDPVGRPGDEGEPIGSRSTDDDAVDDVLEPSNAHDLDVSSGGGGVGGRGGGGVEIDLEELGLAGLVGAVALGQDPRREGRRWVIG